MGSNKMTANIKDFFNHDASNRSVLADVYAEARAQGNLLPCFGSETVLVSDKVEATLISRRKKGDDYTYSREVYPVEKIGTILTSYAERNAQDLERVSEAFAEFLPCIQIQQVKGVLKLRELLCQTIAIVERETGRKVYDPIRQDADGARTAEADMFQDMPAGERRHALLKGKKEVFARIGERIAVDEKSTLVHNDNAMQQIAYATAVTYSLNPQLRN